MVESEYDFTIEKLGKCFFKSPLSDIEFVEGERVLYYTDPNHIMNYTDQGMTLPSFEMAGPRRNIFFDSSKLVCGIVTCGGLCPGINDVIRAIVLSLHYHYGVRRVLGFRYGLEGLTSSHDHELIELGLDVVDDIHQKGGTILGSSRGPQDIPDMVDNLERMGVGILFVIGGDGTLHAARAIVEEASERELQLSVIAVPKTIDNDISFVQKSFGFETAVSETRNAIYSAHMEATGARNGIGLVKFMGRESGFIAAYATMANSDVNYCLVPEVSFTMEAFLASLKKRLERKRHAVIVAAEGAGQELMEKTDERDPSGNIRLGDIGLFLKNGIENYFKEVGMDFTLKYIDPSYTIRSCQATPSDSVFCLLLGHNAVHAGMSGRTNMVIGYWGDQFTHVPIGLAVSRRKEINPDGRLWSNVLSSTGQPAKML